METPNVEIFKNEKYLSIDNDISCVHIRKVTKTILGSHAWYPREVGVTNKKLGKCKKFWQI